MSNDKIKVYKNPARSLPDAHKPYVPQYQLMGVEPGVKDSPAFPAGVTIAIQQKPGAVDSTRGQRPLIRQPYAEAVVSPIGRGRGPLPNVGNNVEQTWSSVDEEIVDDISGVDPDQSMIDNNEIVSNEALGVPENAPSDPKTFLTENELQNALKDELLFTIIDQLGEDEYLLLVNGETICSGPLEYIQEQTSSLVFGEHELYNGNPVSVDDIVVIKKVKIKVGVFLG